MIILEGPDGCGKTTLLQVLCDVLQLKPAERASIPGVGVPADRDLTAWVDQDIGTWHTRPCEVHDRYPLISEPIYGSYLRGKPSIRLDGWYRGHLATVQRTAFVVFCLPPYRRALENATNDKQMPGVLDHYQSLYCGYQFAAAVWTGHHYSYNYEHGMTALANVLARAKAHKEKWYV